MKAVPRPPAFQPLFPSPSFRVPLRSAATPLPLSRSSHVLVTAPAPYAARLAPMLIAANIRPVWMPTIQTDALTDAAEIAALQSVLLELPAYAVLAFTSRTGMQQVGRHMVELANHDEGLSAMLLKGSGIRIAALGKDATAAKDCLGVTADLVPFTASPAALVDFLSADEDLKGAAVLCPIPSVKGMPEPSVVPDFLEGLRQAGFAVTAVPAYETRPVGRDILQKEFDLLRCGEIEAVAFSSAGEAFAFAGMLTEAEMDQLLHRVRDGDLVLAAHGPYTAAGVKQVFGDVDVTVSANFSSFQGLADGLQKSFAERERRSGRLHLRG